MLVASLRSSEHIHHSSPFETGPYKQHDAILRRQKCIGFRSNLLRFRDLTFFTLTIFIDIHRYSTILNFLGHEDLSASLQYPFNENDILQPCLQGKTSLAKVFQARLPEGERM